jgi:hypothetical protein
MERKVKRNQAPSASPRKEECPSGSSKNKRKNARRRSRKRKSRRPPSNNQYTSHNTA